MLAVSILGIKENKKDSLEKLDNLNIDYLHIDVMDGIFVENKTENYDYIKDTKTKKDIHLMVKDIKKYIDEYKKYEPDIITFHYEATNKIEETIKYIKSLNIKVGMAINPNTNIEKITSYLDKLDLVLVMSVEPGKGGQTYIETSTEKINKLKELKEKNKYKYLIEVDGGINNITKEKVKNTDIQVVGSYITNNNYEEKIKEFKEEKESDMYNTRCEYSHFELKKLENVLIKRGLIKTLIVGLAGFLIIISMNNIYCYVAYAIMFLTSLISIILFTKIKIRNMWERDGIKKTVTNKFVFDKYKLEQINEIKTTYLDYKDIYRVIETKTNIYIGMSRWKWFILNKDNCSEELKQFIRKFK